VAVGLAWTPAGGDILFIESTRMPGKGQLIITGSLGDVMRESAEAARTWLRARADALGIDREGLERSDLHLHVPAGAVPDDPRRRRHGDLPGVAPHGPLGAPDVAMTGEITLAEGATGRRHQGNSSPRSGGHRRVLLPEQNRRDVVGPGGALKGWSRHVATVDDVLERALLPQA
jgi:ATP-dependent Lon protease